MCHLNYTKTLYRVQSQNKIQQSTVYHSRHNTKQYTATEHKLFMCRRVRTLTIRHLKLLTINMIDTRVEKHTERTYMLLLVT